VLRYTLPFRPNDSRHHEANPMYITPTSPDAVSYLSSETGPR